MPIRASLSGVLSGFRRRHLVTMALGLARLAPTAGHGLVNVRHVLATWMRFRLGRESGRPRRLVIVSSGARIAFSVRDFVDLTVAEEIFLRHEYAITEPVRPSVILDLGSHIGLSVLWFSAKFPSARIYGFEPDPHSFELLRHNTDGLANVFVRRVAVGGASRTTELYRSSQSWSSSLLSQADGSSRDTVSVEVKTLREILSELGLTRVDILKLDVEGAEWEILDASPLDSVADIVVGELHAGGPAMSRPACGLGRLGSFAVTVAHEDSDRCVFAARRVVAP